MQIKDELIELILEKFGLEPTVEQAETVGKWADFLLSTNRDEVFLLRGYAGTGKTSLVGALVRALMALERHVVLLAPTGRAAKVFSLYSEHPAYTIHKKIYRQRIFSAEMSDFDQNINSHRNTLFIVDEASMISNEGLSGKNFGTGRLLDDLIHFVYAGAGCRLMLVGDSAQLPPVGEELSPALSPEALSAYGMTVRQSTLTQVVRQIADSGILWNATMLRRLINNDEMGDFPRLRLQGFADIRVVPGDELIDQLETSYSRCGTDQTIVVTRSNRRANIFNNGIRGRILMREEEMEPGDQLIVVKNNYFWTSPQANGSPTPNAASPTPASNATIPGMDEKAGVDFLANGDMCVVRRFRNVREMYGLRFADATLRFPDFDDMEMDVTLLLDTLQSEAPALTQEQQRTLFEAVCADYPDIHNRRELLKKVKEDPYYNALQVKFAYAVTCHKSQGGQWQHVYIDQGYVTTDMLTPDYFRWLYTALTRATERIYLINWPEAQVE